MKFASLDARCARLPSGLFVWALTALVGLSGCAGPSPAARDEAAAAAAQAPATSAPAPSAQTAPAPEAPSPPRAQRAPRRAHDAEPEQALPSVDLTPQILFQLLASEIAAQRGQIGSATATYLSLARETRDPRLARRATELALAERSIDHALQAAKLWHELAPDSPLAAQALESLLLATGNLRDAEPLLAARLAAARRDNAVGEFYAQLQRTLGRSADKAGALALADRLAAGDPNVPEARLAVAALASAAGDRQRAAAEAGRAYALRRDDENAAVTAARYLAETQGGVPAAEKLLVEFLARQPRSAEARFAYARLLSSDGRNDAARRQMELALKEEPDSPPILFSLAQIAYQTKQLDVAEDYLNRYLALPRAIQRDNSPAYLFLAQIAEDRGKPEEAIAWLGRVTRGDAQLSATVRRALLLGKLGRVDEARDLLRNTSAASSQERVQLTLAEAQVLRNANRNAEAFEVLDKALERAPTSPELLYDHAMAAERIDRLPVMEASLRKLIALQPDNAHAYNALGYSLADRNLRLDEAQQLIEKALQLAPNDAHILDSMGWVLYRRGQLPQALDYLQKAYAARPETEIAAHLGEVLWKMGRTAEARTLWRDARTREPNNETLKETLARLNVAL